MCAIDYGDHFVRLGLNCVDGKTEETDDDIYPPFTLVIFLVTLDFPQARRTRKKRGLFLTDRHVHDVGQHRSEATNSCLDSHVKNFAVGLRPNM